MNRPFAYAKRRRGIINFMVIFSVGLVALGSALSVAVGALSGLARATYAHAGERAFYTGESALREGQYRYLAFDEEASGTLPSINSAHANTFSSSFSWPYLTVRGTAEAGEDIERNQRSVVTVFPEGGAFAYAVYTNNDLSLAGNAFIDGNIFVNGDMEFTGNSSSVSGDALAGGTIEDTENISGATVEDITPVPPPVIDPAPYKTEAENAGTYFDDVSLADDYLRGETRSAVVFVESASETRIQDTTLTGSLVVTGDLKLTGGTYTASSDHVALYVGGDFEVSGGATINGVVYVAGSTTFGSGNNTVNGTIIAAGGVATTGLSGSTEIHYVPFDIADLQTLIGLDVGGSAGSAIDGRSWAEE